MADSQEATLVFETEEARTAAMDALPETPENEAKLDEIMRAPIKAKEEVAADNPTNPQPVETPSAEPSATSQAAEPVAPPAPAEGSQQEPVFTLKKSDLPEGFDSPGKLLKSYKEAQATLERQTRFIKEKLGGGTGGDPNLQAVLERSKALETELAEMKQKLEKPAQQETKQEQMTAIPESKSAQIREVRQKLQALAKDPETNETEIRQLRYELDDLWLQENERNAIMLERATQRAEAAERRAMEVENKTTGLINKSEEAERSRKATEQLSKEYQDIDEFATSPSYPEFKLSKSATDVEREYLAWGTDVARLYYGAPIDVNTSEGIKAMNYALTMLKRGAPDIIEKCQVAGVPSQASADVQKYLDICDLLDYRDGYRADPVTGKKELVKRYHAPSKQYVPDVFPSLQAAYEDRKIRDGFYAKKVRDAYIDGGKAMAAAASRIDDGAAEMGNADGVSRQGAGLTMTPEQAKQALETIDEVQAVRMKKAGDSSLYNKLADAYKALGMSLE